MGVVFLVLVLYTHLIGSQVYKLAKDPGIYYLMT